MNMGHPDYKFRKGREVLTPPDGNFFRKKAKPSWKISDAKREETQRWLVEIDKSGRKTITEQIRPTRLLGRSKSERSMFTVQVTDGTFVGGHAVQPGDTVICHLATAAELRLNGRGKILSEVKNAF